MPLPICWVELGRTGMGRWWPENGHGQGLGLHRWRRALLQVLGLLQDQCLLRLSLLRWE